jgi:hypothetical protein
MFVYEEKILKEYDVHVLEIVGWEGVWGMMISSIFIAVFFLIPGQDYGSYESPIQATHQIFTNSTLLLSILCSTIVIGPFNYFGTNLTKYSSAMHRCLIDASRMCFVWFISLCCNWENFKIQQAIGYACVLIGNLVYYEIIAFTSKKDDNELPTDDKQEEKDGIFRRFWRYLTDDEPVILGKIETDAIEHGHNHDENKALKDKE